MLAASGDKLRLFHRQRHVDDGLVRLLFEHVLDISGLCPDFVGDGQQPLPAVGPVGQLPLPGADVVTASKHTDLLQEKHAQRVGRRHGEEVDAGCRCGLDVFVHPAAFDHGAGQRNGRLIDRWGDTRQQQGPCGRTGVFADAELTGRESDDIEAVGFNGAQRFLWGKGHDGGSAHRIRQHLFQRRAQWCPELVVCRPIPAQQLGHQGGLVGTMDGNQFGQPGQVRNGAPVGLARGLQVAHFLFRQCEVAVFAAPQRQAPMHELQPAQRRLKVDVLHVGAHPQGPHHALGDGQDRILNYIFLGFIQHIGKDALRRPDDVGGLMAQGVFPERHEVHITLFGLQVGIARLFEVGPKAAELRQEVGHLVTRRRGRGLIEPVGGRAQGCRCGVVHVGRRNRMPRGAVKSGHEVKLSPVDPWR